MVLEGVDGYLSLMVLEDVIFDIINSKYYIFVAIHQK
jgi:hypothetical protein